MRRAFRFIPDRGFFYRFAWMTDQGSVTILVGPFTTLDGAWSGAYRNTP